MDHAAVNRENYSDKPLVAVFIGGTSGIGEYALRALTSHYAANGSPLRLYIVGRKQAAAQTIITECSTSCTQAQFEFVQATDLTSIKDTTITCDKIASIERTKYSTDRPRIDLLIMTQGQLDFNGRAETAEGLDRQLSLLYYSRMRCIMKLMPLLNASEFPRVVSIFGAGLEGKLLLNDLSLRDPKQFSVAQVRSHTCHFTTMAFERFAREHPRISFVHAFPGLVVTPQFDDNSFPIWLKVIWFLVGPVVRRFVALPHAESGQRTISLGTARFPAAEEKAGSKDMKPAVGTDGNLASGAYAVDQNCKPCVFKVDYVKLRKDGFEDTVWDHTMQVFKEIEDTGSFKS